MGFVNGSGKFRAVDSVRLYREFRGYRQIASVAERVSYAPSEACRAGENLAMTGPAARRGRADDERRRTGSGVDQRWQADRVSPHARAVL